jgi:hypothetical protein
MLILNAEFSEVEPTFDSVKPYLYAIKPPVYSSQALFKVRYSYFEVTEIIDDTIQFRVKPSQIFKDEIVRRVGHARPYSAATPMATGSECGLAAY